MPQAHASALVLSTAPLNEQDKLVCLLTSTHGLLKAVAPGAAKMKNRFGSLLELFTCGDFYFYWNEEKELATLSKGEIKESFFDVISAAGNIFYFYLIAEIVLKFIPENLHDERLYKLLLAILRSRRGNQSAMDWLLLYFLVWFLRSEGLLFNPKQCASCSAALLDRAWVRRDYRGLLCASCKTDEPLTLGREELAYMNWTAHHPPGESGVWAGRFQPASMIRLLVGKIEFHGEFALQSSRYLQEFR
ncbi:MAG: DNA repair protein RecO [Candidatus Aminicenantes bacterium]|nr:DNA repair protein RecO [Candidatus Aminicenantes bacterium]